MTDPRPRYIAVEQIAAMRKAANDVWKAHAAEIPEEQREDWKRLCKRHVGRWFVKWWQ